MQKEKRASDLQQLQGDISILADDGGFIPDGIGGRVYVTGSTASYLSTQVTTATASQVSVPASGTNCPAAEDQPASTGVCNAWIYGGFHTATTAADMGLVYDATIGPGLNEQGYKGFLAVKVGSNAQTVVWDTTYDEASYNNGYIAGTAVTQYYYRNLNGKVRLKLEGTATCPTMACTNGTDTTLITIIETTGSLNIASVTHWKLVTTVSSLISQGKVQSDYASIRLDGTLVPSASFQAAEKDHAQVTRDANLKYSFRVDHTLY